MNCLAALSGASFHYEDLDDKQPLVMGKISSSSGQGTKAQQVQERSQLGCLALHTFLALSSQWFDISALVVLGPQLMGALAPADMLVLQRLQLLFGVCALGHVSSLLGCFLWPWRASKLRHQGMLLWTLGLSGFSTAFMGCVPSYSEVRGSWPAASTAT